MNFYNDNDEKVCVWSRALIKAGEIPAGDVVCKSITDIKPDELENYTQCHFFNGISGWAYALKIAGWPTESQVWCASLPCQPFSSAGKQKGFADERHLWPVFFNLVRKCRPQFILGEQVEAAVRLGWLDGVFADLEAEGYTVGAVVLGAHSAGAPHIRQRIYWMAHCNRARTGHNSKISYERLQSEFSSSGVADRLADDQGQGREGVESEREAGQRERSWAGRGGTTGGMGDSKSGGRKGQCLHSNGKSENGNEEADAISAESAGRDVGLGNTDIAGSQGRSEREGGARKLPAGPSGAWNDFDILPCRDGKSRRVEAGTFPLAHGISSRVGLLRGYGNAIVPQTAALFVQAVMEQFSIC